MRKTILLTTGVYLPGYKAGGPIRSIFGIIDKLSNDFDWKVLTTDHDLNSDVPYSGVTSDCWIKVGNAEVWYASRDRRLSVALLDVLKRTPHDALYLNSLFDPYFSVLPMAAMKASCIKRRPVLIAPRGECSEGALGLKSKKKAAYLRTVKFLNLYDGVSWHASGEGEARDIARVMKIGESGVQRINIAPDIPAANPLVPRLKRLQGEPLRVCFLGRIARMKNLDYALKVLARVAKPVVFSVIGPIEDQAYWSECESLISALPPHVKVGYPRAVPADKVGSVLAAQDLLFVPTRGENFGHVFVEALSAGVPILTSDRTPWRNLAALGVGWDLPLGEDQLDEYALRINLMADLDEEAHVAMSLKAGEMGARIHSDNRIIEMNRKMFSALLV